MPVSTETILKGHLSRSDRDRQHFHLVPFRVPPGVAHLRVEFSFTRRLSGDQVGWRDGNILDIGLFDGRGAAFLNAPGFRGWSGSKHHTFFVGAVDATPGYLPGPIEPGGWHVALGLYQIAAEGCDYEIVITMTTGEASCLQPVLSASSQVAPRCGPGWYRGDFHAHTWHSDGTAPLEDLVAAAKGQSLDFIAVTEHNTISHLCELRTESGPDLLLIPGVEISTYRGHANAWPVDGFVEFRCQTDEELEAVRQSIRERGAVFSVNHPKDEGPPWEFGDLFAPDCIEVWGGPWFISNYQSLAMWDVQLRQGNRITAIGGSDKHVGPYTGESSWYDVGMPCTWVYADDLSIRAIVEAVREGRVCVSATSGGPRVELSAIELGSNTLPVGIGCNIHVDRGSTLRLACCVTGARGNVLRLVSPKDTLVAEIDEDDFEVCWDVIALEATYWRAEVIQPPEVPIDEEPAALMALALTNPLYLRVV